MKTSCANLRVNVDNAEFVVVFIMNYPVNEKSDAQLQWFFISYHQTESCKFISSGHHVVLHSKKIA
jgi:hypothetical protein